MITEQTQVTPIDDAPSVLTQVFYSANTNISSKTCTNIPIFEETPAAIFDPIFEIKVILLYFCLK
ncbi:MAG: hypothetical protein GY755_22485 [Chloroflexi bacterium]|nr:hypothetical protein [Chloroflexota bacterium]